MDDSNKENKKVPQAGEDEIQADITDKSKKDPHLIEGVKTGDEKQARYYDRPFDEQMYGSFDEIREQKGEKKSGNQEDAEESG